MTHFAMVAEVDSDRILRAAEAALSLEPVTVTAFRSPKSPGGPHDFFSQADYFWPNPDDPEGPYVNRDGRSNPENFDEHRRAMVDLSLRMPVLTAACLLANDERYARRAGDHLRAWFVNPQTRMNPNLEFSQGVQGVCTGRCYGIIDTLHLVEVARAAGFLGPEALSEVDAAGVREWFREYLGWLKNSEKGGQERAVANNHSTCWALQAAEFARLIGDESTRDEVRAWFVETLLPDQLGIDGSFPRELTRTKPYNYSLFNFDVMAGLAQSLDLTTVELADGRGLRKAAEFIAPFIADKGRWPYPPDVEHFNTLPVRSPGLLFAGLAFDRVDYVTLWKTLDAGPTDREIIRNYPLRQPLLWV